MTLRDILVLIPAIPAAALLVTWWLPWERWLPWSRLLGIPFAAYAAYLAFAAWYFHLGWLAGLLCGVAMIVGISAHIARRPGQSSRRPAA